MAILVVEHSVEDYPHWRPFYERHGSVRKEYGCSAEAVYRDIDDPNKLCVVLEFPTAEQAGRFLDDPTLAPAMAEAKVIAPPKITIGDRTDA